MVFRRSSVRALAGGWVVLAVAVSATLAEDVENKWRFGLGVGGYNSVDQVESNSANTLVTLNPCGADSSCDPGEELVFRAFRDPRSDSQVFGSLDVNPAVLGTAYVQYGLTKTFLIEGSVGYQKGDIGDVEVSARLFGNPSLDDNIDFLFVTRRVTVGEMERVPIRISFLKRLRPRAKLNPYFGLGVGYSIIGLDLDPAFQDLSRNLDTSRGRQTRLEPFFATSGPQGGRILVDGPQLDLSGATVDVRDTFEWHLALGTEVTFKKRWAVFVDARWVDASRSVSIGFNNSDELGNSVPQYAPFDNTPLANADYGPNDVGNCSKDPSGSLDQNGQPVNCTGGGIIDFGYVKVVPVPSAPALTDCINNPSDISSTFCEARFVFTPDGVPDPGQYYVQGGTFEHDGIALQFGVRLTIGK